MQECSANFKAAKDTDTLGGMTWNEFRKAGCVAKTAAAKPAVKKEAARIAPETTTTVTPAGMQHPLPGGQVRRHARRHDVERVPLRRMPAPPLPSGAAACCRPWASIFPTSIAKKYAGQKAGKARMLTCRDQYRANKEAGITEPRWTEEGGGYYSECNKRLSQQ